MSRICKKDIRKSVITTDGEYDYAQGEEFGE